MDKLEPYLKYFRSLEVDMTWNKSAIDNISYVRCSNDLVFIKDAIFIYLSLFTHNHIDLLHWHKVKHKKYQHRINCLKTFIIDRLKDQIKSLLTCLSEKCIHDLYQISTNFKKNIEMGRLWHIMNVYDCVKFNEIC